MSLANVADLDGDGVPDLAVGAPGFDGGTGAVWILFLRSNGTVKSHALISNAAEYLNGALNEYDRFGDSVS